jgi:hypothetical protein
VPAVTGTNTAYAAEWVGIDGYSSSTVEQIGTESDTPAGTGSTYAWYEMYPSGSVVISSAISTQTANKGSKVSATVQAGDSISASVVYTATNQFMLTITDSTAGWTDTITPPTGSSGRYGYGGSSQAQRSSAEWIVEAPSSGYGILPLADFTTPVGFTAASATIGGSSIALNAAPASNASDIVGIYQINMGASSGYYGTGATTTEDTTSALMTPTTASPDVFTVTYDPPATTTPPPTPPTGHHHGRGGSGWRQTNVASPVQAPSLSASQIAAAYQVLDRVFASLGPQDLSYPRWA